MAKKAPSTPNAVAVIQPGKRLPNIINPPVAPPPSRGEIVKAMVEIERERRTKRLAEAKTAEEQAGKVLEHYQTRLSECSELYPTKPDADTFQRAAGGRHVSSITFETYDPTEAPREWDHGKGRWVVTYKDASRDGGETQVQLPRFKLPDKIVADLNALGERVKNAEAATRSARLALEPGALAAVRRSITAEASRPERARCQTLLADPESRKVLERALDRALAAKDENGQALKDADRA